MDVNRRDFLKAVSAVWLQMGLGGAVAGTRGGAADKDATASSAAALNASAAHPGAGLPPELEAVAELFLNPADEVRPGGYWWWFNNLWDKAGITRDLEEFKAKGLGEVLMVHSSNLRAGQKETGPDYLSDEWLALFRFAIQEANRLGIKVGFNLCAGWCMGGPWIRPEESGRWYLQSEKRVTGPLKFAEKLPLPDNTAGYKDVKNPPGIKEYFDLPLEELDYRDTKIIAMPLPPEGQSKLTGERAQALPAKANRMDASNWTPAAEIMDKPLRPLLSRREDAPIPADKVIDLTEKVAADGTLNWDVPAGEWLILRTGSRMTGSRTFLGLPGAEGLSVDWLAAQPVDTQFKNLGEPILKAAEGYVGNTLIYFCDDSFEDGFPNWTGDILEQFKKYRGYDPTPYLGALCGYIIGDAEITDRFLNDYRKTVADLMADRHYGHFAGLCHEHGLKVQNESAGPSRSGTMCMDGMKNLGRSDYPMGEFWLGQIYGEPNDEDPDLGYGKTRLEGGQNKVTKMVASAAHTYGKPLVSAESFTCTRRTHWGNYPHMLRYAADRAFCEGVNRIMIHTVTGSRPQDGKPGYEYYAGTHFNPNVTWWNQSGAFLKYLARCQSLLRSGKFVADVLYYNGDWAPNLEEARHVPTGLGRGYDYDACSAEVLLTRLSVKDGRLVLPDGMGYAMLVLPDTDEMPVEILSKLKELIAAGATVRGPKPERDPGLKNYPQCDEEVRRVSDEIWGKDWQIKGSGSNKYGKGLVAWGPTERQVLQDLLKTPPDFLVNDNSIFVDYIHRRTDSADIYYVVNRTRQKVRVGCSFRVGPRQPWLIDPVSGELRELPEFDPGKTHTQVSLEFFPRSGYFVVFPRGIKSEKPTTDQINFPQFKQVKNITGAWQVGFDPEWGGPAEAYFSGLSDWTENQDDGIKYYSGTATYRKTFDVSAEQAADPTLALDLGVVNYIADVRVNGKDLGTVWTTPWRVSLAGAVQPGANALEIDVTNLWPNRLIGDSALSDDKRVTQTNIEFKPTDELLPSGLLGPVTLQSSMG